MTCSYAAKGGHLEILKWARENGCPWNENTRKSAAKGGHLEVLKWARENGCWWNSYMCAYAAKGGHLEVLKWLRANDCPWDEQVGWCAAREVATSRCCSGRARTAARGTRGPARVRRGTGMLRC